MRRNKSLNVEKFHHLWPCFENGTIKTSLLQSKLLSFSRIFFWMVEILIQILRKFSCLYWLWCLSFRFEINQRNVFFFGFWTIGFLSNFEKPFPQLNIAPQVWNSRLSSSWKTQPWSFETKLTWKLRWINFITTFWFLQTIRSLTHWSESETSAAFYPLQSQLFPKKI